MSWHEFEIESKDMAVFGRDRLDVGPAYLATTAQDGSPRVHPVTPLMGDEVLGLYMFPTSPKGHDLRRDPRYALHSTVLDKSGTGGEFSIRGLALWGEDDEVADRLTADGIPHNDDYVRFELRVSHVMTATYEDDTNIPTIRRWSPDTG